MTLEAAGAYLQRLREEARITRHAMAKRAVTSDSQIIRIEQGQETRFSLLATIIRIVEANADDVIDLILSESTIKDGIERAELWIDKRKSKKNGITAIHPDVSRLIARMGDYELGRWVLMGERMLEEQTKR
ncbi:MAG: helix-turn-helix transcriptional regulator [Chloroflexales bacterium]